jgi:hypothetical protein
MTDQDPTQRYDPPTAVPQPPAAQPADAQGAAVPPGMPAYAPPPSPAPEGLVSDAVATSPVAATAAPGPTGRKHRLRWIAALVVTLLVAGTAAGATLLLTSDSGDPEVLAWTPADSLAYAELRLDLPGSQQAELAKLMSAFPGFDDQAAFPMKLNEALDQLVGSATDGEQSWTADIDPWFGRQLSVSVGPLPANVDDAANARGLLLASVTDAAKAEAWAAKLVADKGATTTTETYAGATITLVTPKDGAPAAMADVRTAYAIIGPVLALGDEASVKAAIDTKGTAGLNTVDQFKTAEATVSGDRLAFAYMDTAALTDSAKALAGEAAEAMPSLPAAFDDLTPPWSVAAVRAEDGSFVVDTRNPHVSKLGPAEASDTTLASVLPPTTVALVEGHDVGASLTRLKDLVASDPALADGVKQVEDALAIVGGWDAVVGWMGEAGIAVMRDGDAVGGGLVVTPTDAAAAERLLTQLKGFVQLAGAGSGITVTEEAYAGTTITTIDLGDLGDLAGAATDGAVDVPGNLEISYAVTDQVVVIGYGTAFTKAVLDTPAGGSLADTDRFKSALAQAGTTHASLFWLDVTGVRDLVEAQVPAADKAEYDADVKPYLEAFDSVIGTYAPAEDIDRGTVIIRVVGE